MRSWFQFVREVFVNSRTGRRVIFPLLFLSILPAYAAPVRDQDPPPGAIAWIQGNDISVDSGTTTVPSVPASGSTLFVTNGGVVVVHSGDARMALLGGGEVQICGPAKFTVLSSGNAITLALNFGRLHVELPAKTALRIFTPTIIATPIDISGGARDVTVGLSLNDSLCVLASGGALQLEHQFSGEKLIVPQSGEFQLDGGRLRPVAGTAASCACEAMQNGAPQSEPLEHAGESAPVIVPMQPKDTADTAAKNAGAAVEAGGSAGAEFAIGPGANESHPVVPARKASPASTEPPPIVPAYTVTVPPLSFLASFPKPPPDPELETMLLVREAQVLPEWEFTGRVAAPAFAGAMKKALGEGPSPEGALTGSPGEKRGFWGLIKSIFVGH
jgi:hypothetical protein